MPKCKIFLVGHSQKNVMTAITGLDTILVVAILWMSLVDILWNV